MGDFLKYYFFLFLNMVINMVIMLTDKDRTIMAIGAPTTAMFIRSRPGHVPSLGQLAAPSRYNIIEVRIIMIIPAPIIEVVGIFLSFFDGVFGWLFMM